MPHSAEKLLDLLGQEEEKRTFAALGKGGRLVPGTALPEPQGVFPRYVEPEAAAESASKSAPKEKQTQKAKEKPQQKTQKKTTS
jgi:methionyl-tRNA synthetase